MLVIFCVMTIMGLVNDIAQQQDQRSQLFHRMFLKNNVPRLAVSSHFGSFKLQRPKISRRVN